MPAGSASIDLRMGWLAVGAWAINWLTAEAYSDVGRDMHML